VNINSFVAEEYELLNFKDWYKRMSVKFKNYPQEMTQAEWREQYREFLKEK
jgi:hypothetical protein